MQALQSHLTAETGTTCKSIFFFLGSSKSRIMHIDRNAYLCVLQCHHFFFEVFEFILKCCDLTGIFTKRLHNLHRGINHNKTNLHFLLAQDNYKAPYLLFLCSSSAIVFSYWKGTLFAISPFLRSIFILRNWEVILFGNKLNVKCMQCLQQLPSLSAVASVPREAHLTGSLSLASCT